MTNGRTSFQRFLSSIIVLAGLFFVMPAAVAAEPDKRPRVIGHRGLLEAAPENTLAGFRACLELRVGFEFDVRRTKDGKLVCLHDETLDRTTDGSGLVGKWSWDDAKKLDAGKWFDPKFSGEHVPGIDEIFGLVAECPSGPLVAVDLKETGNGVEEAVVELAQTHKVLERLVFIGATIESDEIRARLKAASKDVQAARLAAAPESIEAAIADASADWVYVRFLPSPELVQRVHKAGKRIFLAGPLVAAKEAENWRAAAELGMNAILTDHPLELSKQLRLNSSKPRKVSGYQTRTMDGWSVFVSEALLADESKATQTALDLLQEQLDEIVRKVPAKAVARLREVPLWFSPEYPGVPPRAEYHPDAGWLRANGRNLDMARGVEFTNVRIFEKETRRMPNFALHELAHAFHDRVLGFENGDINAAFERAKESKSYAAVERWHGPDRPITKERAYAMTNAKEYFAETTEALFSRNDFFPFTAAELEKHDPEMSKLLLRLWSLEAK